MTTTKVQALTIEPPSFQTAEFKIIGDSPYVQNKFSKKAMNTMMDKQKEGSTAAKGKKRTARDFKADYEGAKHKSRQGWCGIPAPAFRSAMIRACSVCGFKMTIAKMTVFVEADGFDPDDGTPLVKITKGKPHSVDHAVRNATGVADIRSRPMWNEGWEAKVRIKYDSDQFKLEDVANLLMRAGQQVGVGEGRPSSKSSNGMGWGTFVISNGKK